MIVNPSLLMFRPEESTMQAAKQDALNIIKQLPDNADMEEIMYRLYVLDKIRKGQKAVEGGETLTSEELQRDIDLWWFGQNLPRQALSICSN